MKEEDRKEFLKRWRKEASTGKACFNDITSISSYSRENELVEFGYNKDHEDLPQIVYKHVYIINKPYSRYKNYNL